ncbi:beta-ureidopropionase [Leptinotarsa decemlineata]|uniref:beta-ureidopropionase n=1 Tax=Leptinotarsa decemlineata TaxID=7539 RepID=UPI003D309F16
MYFPIDEVYLKYISVIELVDISLLKMSLEKEPNSVESILKRLNEKDFKQVWRILYGDGTEELKMSEKCLKLATRYKVELVSCKFRKIQDEQIRNTRMVKVGLFQQKLPVPLTNPIRRVKMAMYTLAMDAIKVAAKGGVNIFCLQQAWNMPYAFCKGEKLPWCDYAENAEDGPTTRILQALAAENKMVIISTILERDENCEDNIWNTAVVIDNHGNYLGKHRRNHIPKVENANEPTYYCEGNTGHPVFKTEYGKIAVNICYGRHIPLNWIGFALNGAEIVFNPCAAIGDYNEPLWGIEARNAAIANGYFVCAINRVGTEIYEHEYEDEEGNKEFHKDSGHFFGSTYVAAPNGTRSPGLSRTKDGLLIAEFDLNMCRQIKDERGFDVTQRLQLYQELLSNIMKTDFKPQIIKKR